MSTKLDIGSVLKTSLEGYTATADDLWPAIESKLKRRKRNRALLILLLLLGTITAGILLANNLNETPNDAKQTTPIETTVDTDSKSSDDNDSNDKQLQELDKKDLTNSSKTDITTDTDTITQVNTDSNDINSNRTDALDKNSVKSKNTKKSGKNNDNTTNSDSSSSEYLQRDRKPRFNSLMAIKAKTLDSLTLKLDSIALWNESQLNEELENDTTRVKTSWGFSPYISLDHYNAFGRETSKQFTFNQGFFIAFYGTNALSLRTGYKNLELQYDFQGFNGNNQQQIRYIEVPLEARYFLSEKRFKPSFIVGGSYLFLLEATLTDFGNNIIRDNQNIFRSQMFSVNAGLGLHYDLNDRWRINVESVFKYHTFPFDRNQGVSPFTISTSFGIEYRLNLK